MIIPLVLLHISNTYRTLTGLGQDISDLGMSKTFDTSRITQPIQ